MKERLTEGSEIDLIFDELERQKDPIWDIIRMFQNGRDVHELERVLEERPHLLTTILYIMRELTSNVVLPIWRTAAEHVSSEDWETAYYSLNVVEAVLPHVGTEEALRILSRVRIDGELVEERITAITAALDARK